MDRITVVLTFCFFVFVFLSGTSPVYGADEAGELPPFSGEGAEENPAPEESSAGEILPAGADAGNGDAGGSPAPEENPAGMDMGGGDAAGSSSASQIETFLEFCRTGSPEAVAQALAAGQDANGANLKGVTPLMRAAGSNTDPAVLTVLLEAGAEPNAANADGDTPLIYAASNPNPQVLRVLLDAGAELNAVSKERSLFHGGGGITPLMAVVLYNLNPEGLRILLDAGAELNVQSANGATALMFAAFKAEDTESIHLLLEAGADVKAKAKNGETALFYGANQKHPEIITALIEAGGEVDARSENGRTPLMLAVQLNTHSETIAAFLDGGADSNAQDRQGMSPLILAARNERTEIVRLLVGRGADPALADNDGNTALHHFVENRFFDGQDSLDKRLELISLLLKAGAPVDAKNIRGLTPLMTAVEQGADPEVLSLLLASGADINAQDEQGLTPLMYAAKGLQGEGGDPRNLVFFLLGAGADARIRDYGRTAADYARENVELRDTQAYQALYNAQRRPSGPGETPEQGEAAEAAGGEIPVEAGDAETAAETEPGAGPETGSGLEDEDVSGAEGAPDGGEVSDDEGGFTGTSVETEAVEPDL
jgi:ankyrin repeat protein